MSADIIAPEFPRPDYKLVQTPEKSSFVNSEGKEEMYVLRKPIPPCPLSQELPYNLGQAFDSIWRHVKGGLDGVDGLQEAQRWIDLEIKRVGK